MRLWLAAVGRLRAGGLRSTFDEFANRLVPPLTVHEVEARRRQAPTAQRRQEEAALLLAAVPASATRVALDERGQAMTSAAFARQLESWRDHGVGDLAFLIGGADGLDDRVRAEAALLLAFGPMTWPHLLVRVMLAEQLYRAQQILAGHPYHRG